jgi:hypothetical protein
MRRSLPMLNGMKAFSRLTLSCESRKWSKRKTSGSPPVLFVRVKSVQVENNAGILKEKLLITVINTTALKVKVSYDGYCRLRSYMSRLRGLSHIETSLISSKCESVCHFLNKGRKQNDKRKTYTLFCF